MNHRGGFGSRYSRATGGYGRLLRVEPLEPRLLLAGDTYLINFQLAGAPVPTRYVVDAGEVFGARGDGLTYGWSANHSDVSRDRNVNPDQRLDTLIHFKQGQTWELSLPNGLYEVTVGIGDPQFSSTHTLNVEGANFWTAVPLSPNDFRMQTQQIAVADGRLTLNQGAAANMATRINFIHVVGLPAGPNAAPGTPTITEPVVEGQMVNPGDVHLEAIDFVDADGDAHLSTDWEIWTVGPGAQPVWQTLGITGVERLHTHLGDGMFINSHAGRTDLLANSDFELRVRFRDDAGSVSSYAVRTFRTGPASTVFPLELQDVPAITPPTWANAAGSSIVFAAASPFQSQLQLESAAGELFVSLTGHDGSTNLVTNPPPLGHHAPLRIVLTAGSNGLNLGQSTLTLRDEVGREHAIYLPPIVLAAVERLDLWVASDGSTYYGTPAQTEPDFSNLARQAELPVPFLALAPGFVVETVAGGFQLPTNIAFVPNPGGNPDDPLFYVTELYGTIKVVSNDFTVSTFATGLLNFNPTGAFPGSGEQGLTGIAVDPLTGDVFAARVTATNPANPNGDHHPQVLRFTSNDSGRTASGPPTVILNMIGETQGQSHQISNVSIGPDGKLYVHMGDGFNAGTALNLDSYRGKILRLNLDGTAPADNPFYNAANGISARDYVFAYGFRNPFGGAWRAADGKLYEVENGNSIDRLARVDPGVSYGWAGSDSAMLVNAIYNWDPSHAPVNIAFVQPETFGGSQFPAWMQDRAFVSESGPTYATGPQVRGKRIVGFEIDVNGNHVSGPTTLVEYVGTGKASIVGLAAGPDGLYMTELYKDLDAASPIEAGARVLRVRYVNPLVGDYDIDGDVDQDDHTVWRNSFGSTYLLAADGNHNGIVDAADYTVWRDHLGATLAAGSGSTAMAAPAETGMVFPPPVEFDGSLDSSHRAAVRTSPLSRPAFVPWQPGNPRKAALLSIYARALENRQHDDVPAPATEGAEKRDGAFAAIADECFARLDPAELRLLFMR